MSRIGKKPILVPEKVKVTYSEKKLTVQGAKGILSRTIHPDLDLSIEDGAINVVLKNDDRKVKALQGMTRSIVDNMVVGVSKGFERILEINGIGYRAEAKGNNIIFNLGFSHPVDFALPEGISAEIDKNNTVKLSGIDKEKLGQVAASIRRIRPPEPYKGKGVKYLEEKIQKKAGKTGTK
ncbi:MAG: 50S ribosomal protein L6 [Proteobacteria bacterium]|nr:50S ribosomal protein L6 [Desulfobacteraceae bacterium]MBU4319133.1 50S ribosomal protein L6 [Pseudomonadota bacterium]MBU4469256.1 50S ribosomal protein L6 [Pseudomonadota bacterium]MCG2752286.1 50S ribosomal protein L6 [Desulfobacteraceae bacterium]